jgi:hypothetical protein
LTVEDLLEQVDIPASTCVERTPPQVLNAWSSPVIDPVDCSNQAPTVAVVRHGDLPPVLADHLVGYAPDTALMLYVPPAQADGSRTVRLKGNPECIADRCENLCNRPTHEKCPPPSPHACATAIELPHQRRILLSGTAAARGLIIAADRIEINGPVRTNGADLVLLAEELVGSSGPRIDASALRRDIAQEARAGGQLVIAAGRISGEDLTLASHGAPGGYPKTTHIDAASGQAFGIHWNCADDSNDAAHYGNPDPERYNPHCFPCLTRFADVCAAGTRKFIKEPYELKCVTGIVEVVGSSDNAIVGTLTYISDYPSSEGEPIMFPSRFLQRAPDGADGGARGRIALLAASNAVTVTQSVGTGNGSRGLEGYQVSQLPASTYGEVGSYTVPSGVDGAPTSQEMAVRHPGSDANLNTADLHAVIAHVADDFLGATRYLRLGDRRYREGNSWTGLTYLYARFALGSPVGRPCSLTKRFKSLWAEASGRLSQFVGGLDYGGRSALEVSYVTPARLRDQAKDRLDLLSETIGSLKLDALTAMVAAELEALIEANLAFIEGEVGTSESALIEAARAESEARQAALAVYVDVELANLEALRGRLAAHYLEADPQPDFLALAGELAEDIATMAKAGVALVKGADMAESASALWKAGSSAYEKLDRFAEELAGDGEQCDAECRTLTFEIAQAQRKLYAAQLDARAATAALATVDARGALLEARLQAARDVTGTLQGVPFVVAAERLARGAQFLCRFGKDQAEKTALAIQDYKRSCALWDVPAPAQASIYGADGIDYGFLNHAFAYQSLLLEAALADFEQQRPAAEAPNLKQITLGTTDAAAAALAELLRGAPVTLGTGANEQQRHQIELGVIEVDGSIYLGAFDSGGAPPQTPVINAAVELADKWALQVLSTQVRAFTAEGVVRDDFPFVWIRSSSDAFVNDLQTGAWSSFVMNTLATQDLDFGRLADQALWDGNAFVFTTVDVAKPAGTFDHPEALRKPWILSVRRCQASEPPSSACATAEEIAAIERLRLGVLLRYKL